MKNTTHTQLCLCYGLGDAIACTPLGGTRNQNLALTTSSGRWFLRRRHAGYADPERIAFDHAVLRTLATRGVPVVTPLDTVHGHGYWTDGSETWEVYPFVEGRQFQERSIEDAAALGACVGALHEAGRDVSLRFEKIGPRGETDPRTLSRQADEIKADSPDTAVPLRRYREWLREAATNLSDVAYAALPHTLIHGDLQPANVLMGEGRVAALVDWDWCAWRPRVYDLAFALLFCCSRHETPIEGGDIWSLTQPAHVDAGLAWAFMKAYEEEAGTLSPAETSALRAQTVLSWCHTRIAGALKVEKERRAKFLGRGPERVDDFGTLNYDA